MLQRQRESQREEGLLLWYKNIFLFVTTGSIKQNNTRPEASLHFAHEPTQKLLCRLPLVKRQQSHKVPVSSLHLNNVHTHTHTHLPIRLILLKISNSALLQDKITLQTNYLLAYRNKSSCEMDAQSFVHMHNTATERQCMDFLKHSCTLCVCVQWRETPQLSILHWKLTWSRSGAPTIWTVLPFF